jgi:hypothetical protein
LFAFGVDLLVIKLSSSIKIWYAILAYSLKKGSYFPSTETLTLIRKSRVYVVENSPKKLE